MEIEFNEINIPTPKGHLLAVCKFSPKQTTNYTLVITSATGVLQKYYSRFASFFAKNGFTVYTFDYHGIGKSSSSTTDLKSNNSNATSWGQNDQATIVAFAKKENPNSKLCLITHSIGGQLLGFNPNYHMLDKVVMIASQTGYWKQFPGLHKIKMWLFWYLIIPIPTAIFGYFPAKKLGLFENLPKQVVTEWASWGKQPNYLMHYHDKQTYFFDKFELPILVLSFSKDTYAPKALVDWLAKLYKNATILRMHHKAGNGEKDLKHFGFFKSWAQDPYWHQCLNYIRNGRYEL